MLPKNKALLRRCSFAVAPSSLPASLSLSLLESLSLSLSLSLFLSLGISRRLKERSLSASLIPERRFASTSHWTCSNAQTGHDFELLSRRARHTRIARQCETYSRLTLFWFGDWVSIGERPSVYGQVCSRNCAADRTRPIEGVVRGDARVLG